MTVPTKWLSVCAGLLFSLLSIQPALAQTDYYAEKAARIKEMRANMVVTQAQREAAAAELKAFKLKIEQAKKAAIKAGLTRPESVQLPPGVPAPGPNSTPDYFTTANWAFSPPLRKFVDALPGLSAANANALGNYVPVAVPDSITYPGSDYYEISLRQYQHQFHSDLPATTLRGYVQTNLGTDVNGVNTVPPEAINYLGPVIVAQKDRPVRIKFTNELPTGAGGDLMVPVDESIMGSGKGALFPDGTPCDPTPTASVPPGNATQGQNCARYTQNRAAVHLHGGRTPWISDGTPHQWVIPATEWANTPYKEGVSMENVPDMPNPGPGSATYYYSNQQSARLMFYHDHAWGITRLNVLVGMAAGYLIRDDAELGLISTGALPADEIPLVIQDRTFVDATDVRVTDPTWNWGTGPINAVDPTVRDPKTGDLWIPHVYVPAQNPYDPTGVNPFGRWVYGPWFFPPTTNILFNTVPNPYHDPACSDPDPAVFAFCTTPGQPPVIPGTPTPSVGAETFFDTATINGQAFPTITVQPKAYRFRILNAANDRFFNLNLFKADPAQIANDGRTDTEIRMVPSAATAWDPALYPNWPADGRAEGVPDPTQQGPSFIQVGTEGGFLPRPVVVPPQPITFVLDPTAFNVGNVKDFGLFLGPAERADVVVDFSAYAGQTLILYNDAPAAVPAFDPRFDYHTGAGDLSDTGGYGRPPPWNPAGLKDGPQIGYGPNTRTVMQIKVAAGTPVPFDLPRLEAAFAPNPAIAKPGVFEANQDPIIVGQDAYNGVYTGVTFPQVWPYWGLSRIEDQTLSFLTVGGSYQTFPMEPKGMHDEMGASFDMEYGRMSTNLGMTNPNRVVGMLNLTTYKFSDPATEVLNDAMTPLSPVLGDGTQIWKISHNGVDMHPIHFHIFDVQVINRVGWDGQIRPPHPSELGWKDTVRIAPLEDTIVAMRPWAPKLPFGVPNSLRPLNPAIPLNSPYGFTNIDPVTQQPKVPPDVNRIENLGWEYVWHCHILSHEENDMMRPIVLNVVSGIPGSPSPLTAVANGSGQAVLSWADATPVDYVTQANFGNPSNEIAFRVDRSTGVGVPFTTLGFTRANQTTYTDTTATPGSYYRYRVVAYNEGGSAASNAADFGTPPAATAATGLTVTANPPSPYLRDILGVPTLFSATATGGTGIYEFRFSLSLNGGPFSVVQAYGPASTWTMPVTQPAGNLVIRTEVRTSATVANDVVVDTPYVLTVPAPATGVLLSAPVLQPSPGLFGTAVTFTAAGQGSVGTFQYRFSLQTGAGAFVLVQDWATLNTWTLPATTLPGSYTVQVEARTDTAMTPVSATLPYVIQYPVATAVTLRPSTPSPYTLNIVPAPVSFLATGSGAGTTPSTAYNYQFSLDSGAGFVVAQPYSTSRVWNLPTTTPAGTYTVRVEVKTNLGAATADTSTTLPYVIVNAPAATGVTLTANLTSPQVPGTPVVFTAVGAGSSGYQYQFLMSTNGGAFAVVQPWSTTATWTLPGTTPAGNYAVQVEVRASPLAVAAEFTSAAVPMAIRSFAPATGVTVTPSRVSPAIVNIVPVATTFTALGTGSTGGYDYRFSLSTNGGAFVLVQDYGVGPTWTLPAATPAGAYQVQVDVRTSPTVAFDATTTVPFDLVNAPAATGVTLTAGATSPQVTGTPVTFTAAGAGSSGYEYRFLLSTNAGAFVEVQPFSATATWTLPGTTVPGSYAVQAEVRASPLSVAAEFASTPVAMTIAAFPTATGVTLSANQTSPKQPGTNVTFTAAGSGAASYFYRFLLSTSGGAFVEVQPFSATASWTLSNPVEAAYVVQVEVKAALANPAVDATASMPFIIRANAAATGVTISANRTSPAPIEFSPIATVFTAAGTGAVGGYDYRFSVSTNGGAFALVQGYGNGAVWTMPASTPAASYVVKVDVRTSAVVDLDATTSMPFQLVLPPKATSATITASPVSVGTRGVAQFNATCAGSTSPCDFQFQAWNGTAWTVVQAWGNGSRWTVPASMATGTYTVIAEARTSSLVVRDVYSNAVSGYVVIGTTRATSATLTATPAGTGNRGVAQFTATCNGTPDPCDFQFQAWNGTAWTIVQPWGNGSTWVVPVTMATGTYSVVAEARTSPLVVRDVYSNAISGYVVTNVVAATSATLVASPPGSGQRGIAQFSATCGGTTSPCQFQFHAFNGTSWTIVQPYGVGSTWVVPVTMAAGTYSIAVEARTSTTVARDVWANVISGYQIVGVPPATSATLTVTPTVTGARGVAQFSATCGGTTSPCEFQFQAWNGTAWSIVQAYGVGSTWIPPVTMAAGTYTVVVETRTDPLKARDVWSNAISGYVLQ